MQLRDYRRAKRLTLADVAELMGSQPITVSRHERGLRLPDAVQIERYRKITGGAVQHEDWVKAAKQRPPRPKGDALPAASTPQPEEKSVA